MWWMMGDNFPGWWMGIGLLWSLIFWGGLILLAVWAIRLLGSRPAAGREGGARVDPLTILKERYARGELTREQFEQMKADIQ